MKLNLAIEIAEKHGVMDETTTWGDYLEAIKLLIEAGKYVIGQYDPDHQMMRKPLPGETEE